MAPIYLARLEESCRGRSFLSGYAGLLRARTRGVGPPYCATAYRMILCGYLAPHMPSTPGERRLYRQIRAVNSRGERFVPRRKPGGLLGPHPDMPGM